MIAASVGLRGVLVAAAVAAAIGDGASAEKLARQRSAPRGELLREASLVAHVRIAQAAELRGGQPHYFAHIIDAAQGPPAGQMVLLAHDEQRGGAPLAWKTGERYIVLARRLPGGVYAPLASEASIVSVDESGAIADAAALDALAGPHAPRTAEGVVAHLWNECRGHDFRIHLRLDEPDLRRYAHGRPLRAHVEIANTGGVPLEVENFIDYEYHHPVGERLKELEEHRVALRPKIFLQSMDERHDLARLLDRLARLNISMTLAPGERCGGAYDLAEANDICRGGKFQAWAELGGRRSNCVAFELPRSEEARELEALAEQLESDDGPLERLPPPKAARTAMPAVESALESAVLDAVLAAWCKGQHGGDGDAPAATVLLLRTPNVPVDYLPKVSGVLVIQTDALIDSDQRLVMQLANGKAVFAGAAVRVDDMTIDDQQAKVQISRHRRHGLDGSGATFRLRRAEGRWEVASQRLFAR